MENLDEEVTGPVLDLIVNLKHGSRLNELMIRTLKSEITNPRVWEILD